MQTLSIWRGSIVLLDDGDEWPRLWAPYAPFGVLRRELEAGGRAGPAPRRAGVRSAWQLQGWGEWVAILGGSWAPAAGGPCVIEVQIGGPDGLERWLAEPVLDGALTALAGGAPGPGTLRVDRATVHPVDCQPWAFRAASFALVKALCGGLEPGQLCEEASAFFSRRGR
ncbi:MAG: hypothetical protein MUF64_03740 [Polyangiaceae bacterium]|jgi:hypothetical protein|nr:hypothetical protein [Polyangiaceae bacterium]